MAANTRGIRAGKAYVELGVNDKIQQGLRRAHMRLRAFGAGVRTVGAQMTAMAAVPTAALGLAVRHFAAAGDSLEKMSRRTGIAVEALSELGFAASQSGSDLETLEAGVRVLQRTINDAERGTKTAVDALADLGLTAEALRRLSTEDQFKVVADRLAGIGDHAKRAATAMLLFGRSGTRLLPLVEGGAEGLEAMQQQARRFGLTVSGEAAKRAAVLTDALDLMRRVLDRVRLEIGDALSPTVTRMARAVTGAAVAALQWVKGNRQAVIGAANATAAFAGLSVAVLASGVAIVALLSPAGLALAAVAALGTAIFRWSGLGSEALAGLRYAFGELAAFASKVVGGMADALAAGDIQLAAEVLWLGLKVAWQRGALELSKVWGGVRSVAIENVLGALGVIEAAWINSTAFLSKTWTAFASSFSRIWQVATTFVAKRMLEIQGLFDSGLDVDAAKRALDDQLESRLAEIEGQAASDIDARERKRVEALRDLWQVIAAAQAAAESGAGGAVAESQRELDEAKRRLDEALAEARARREGLDSDPSRGAGILDGLDGIGEQIARRLDVRGTFSARALQGLAATGNSADRTAKATEETAKNTKRLLAAARSGGLTFT